MKQDEAQEKKKKKKKAKRNQVLARECGVVDSAVCGGRQWHILHGG